MGEENEFEQLKKSLRSASYLMGKRMQMIGVEYTEIIEDTSYVDTVRESEELHLSTMTILERETFYAEMLFWMPADVRRRLDEIDATLGGWTTPKDDIDKRRLEYLWRTCMVERSSSNGEHVYRPKDEVITVLRALQGQVSGRLRRVPSGSEPGRTDVYLVHQAHTFDGVGGGAIGLQWATTAQHDHQPSTISTHVFSKHLVASPKSSFAERPMYTVGCASEECANAMLDVAGAMNMLKMVVGKAVGEEEEGVDDA